MKLFDLFETVKIDNVKGLGEVPDNQNVDYLGLRVSMRPSVFLKLAAALPREQAESAEYIKQHLEKGGGIAAPWLVISVPPEWENNDLEQPARVVGHEGRNRVYAVIETEGDSAVETHLFFSGGVRNRHIKPKWIERLNNSVIPEGKTLPIGGPFFTTQPTLQEVGGVGIVVKGVNTTADVGPREIQKQARKFLNKVTAGGIPPQTQSNGKIPLVK